MVYYLEKTKKAGCIRLTSSNRQRGQQQSMAAGPEGAQCFVVRGCSFASVFLFSEWRCFGY